ncbi:MAG: DUF819 family protein [Gemmatimonadota bacterium]|nr:DUF819 family protein [Gemmatimonadota bacterium]MDE2866521.1 DUF819 family protein [Gemmatimonadota bacterium]MYB06364.1 DUF819 family protein [Gemmatimonadota bacterium]MYE17873.1 DUF819 family protein [Gemmatimonadota bacterium]MYG24206.1 DUF819 family protein [Gemmatimonadota bacterium]
MPQETTALINDPMGVFAFLAGLVALIFWVSELPRCKKLFEVVPPVIYVYFLPMLATTAGITPAASPLYDWTVPYLLLFALLMLMVSVDLGSVARLGPVALFMVAAGTIGIVIGGPISLMLFGGMLPEDAWTGFAALSGSWIGGTANMVAIAESVGTSPDAMGPVIVVDTVVGYGWMGVLIAMVGLQGRFDRRTKARTDAIEQTNRRLEEMKSERRPLTLRYAVVMIGFGMACAVLAQRLGQRFPAVGDPTIISGTTWAILIVVTGGLVLSFTPLRKLETVGASHLGYTALYLLLAGIGAQADLRAVLDAPVYLLAGAVWIAIHLGVLLIAARIVRAPLFFVATGSMANVGGAASAPVVAGVYHRAMAPIGLLMAVAGYILGIYAAIVCAWLLGLVGG